MARNKKAPGHFERRGRGWGGGGGINGKYSRVTIATTERAEAERWARAKYEELDRQALRRTDGLPVGLRMSDLIAYYEAERLPRLAPGTQKAYRGSLTPIRRYFLHQLGDPPLDRIRQAHVGDFLDWRRHHRLNGSRPLDGRTVAKDRTFLHCLFDVAEEKEWREGNPVTKVKLKKTDGRQPVILSDLEYKALLGACRDGLVRLYVLVLGETGARCESEVLWLRWEDVDLEGGFITIVSGRGGHRVKGGRTRSVPMTPRLSTALREHFAEHRFAAYDGRRPAFIFHHQNTRRHYRAGDRVQSFRSAVNTAALQ